MNKFKILMNRFYALIRSPYLTSKIVYARLLKTEQSKLKLKILDPAKTLNVLLDEKKLFIRLGDGEIQLILGIDIGYQKALLKLKKT